MRIAECGVDCGLAISDCGLIAEWIPQSTFRIQQSNPHSAIRIPQY